MRCAGYDTESPHQSWYHLPVIKTKSATLARKFLPWRPCQRFVESWRRDQIKGGINLYGWKKKITFQNKMKVLVLFSGRMGLHVCSCSVASIGSCLRAAHNNQHHAWLPWQQQLKKSLERCCFSELDSLFLSPVCLFHFDGVFLKLHHLCRRTGFKSESHFVVCLKGVHAHTHTRRVSTRSASSNCDEYRAVRLCNAQQN